MQQTHRPSYYKEQDLTYNPKLTVKEKIKPQQPVRCCNMLYLNFAICTLCLSKFYFGYCMVYISALSKNTMIQEFGSVSQKPIVHGLFYGLLTLGGAFGSFFSGLLMKRYTRRKLMILLNCGALIIQGLLQIGNIYSLYVCRVLQGYILGNFLTLLPAYISQLSPKQLLVNYRVFNQLFFVLGVMYAYMLGTFLQKVFHVNNTVIWRLMFGFNIFMIIYLLVCCCLDIVPQSPKSHIRNGNKSQALDVLSKYIKPELIEQVYNQKFEQVNKEILGIIPDTKELRAYSKKAFFVAFLLPFMQALTGINAILSQIGFILEDYNFQFGYYVPLILSCVQFLAVYSSIYVIKQFGRRSIILVGSFALALIDIMVGLCFFYADEFRDTLWIMFAILFVYMIIYGLTLAPVVWTYIPEIVPSSVVPFAATVNLLTATFCLTLSPLLTASFGPQATYFCFGGVTSFITLINIFRVKESKGLNQEQIRKSFFTEKDLQRMNEIKDKYIKQSESNSSNNNQIKNIQISQIKSPINLRNDQS